ncbi:hypothetical protein EI42_04485 [Thermosporothrix hazakensis]|jgi:hypothetical protein|uniref:Uncharacterized protein n=2 Tax=Thermosporothrix hazakensis TaxID=644383 RepID=A0A326U2E8_THEHA|nr:hypothetical protein EI42_04485 [Thermosporothrix hazakensis]GCE46435.1 hypothetical protein KTH_13040 [Thermosporothrix hazakensis]
MGVGKMKQHEENYTQLTACKDELAAVLNVLQQFLSYARSHPPEDEKGVNHVEAVRRFVERVKQEPAGPLYSQVVYHVQALNRAQREVDNGAWNPLFYKSAVDRVARHKEWLQSHGVPVYLDTTARCWCLWIALE